MRWVHAAPESGPSVGVDSHCFVVDNIWVPVTWADSVDEHDIPREEAMYAMSHAHQVTRQFGRPRVGAVAPTLFIGPSRYGTLEVLATITPPDGVWVFHVQLLRESTRLAVGYTRDT
jgi:hypothetical protein